MIKKYLLAFMALFMLGVSYQAHAQYCTATHGSNCDEEISRFFIGTFANEDGYCGDQDGTDDGYTDYSKAFTIDLKQGQTYSIKVVNNAGDYGANEYVRVWFDWNRDNSFSSTEYVALSFAGSATYSGSIEIPASSKTGSTKMRVRMCYNNSSAGPCATDSSGWGATEDYTINIQAAQEPVVITGQPVGGTYCASAGTVNLSVSSTGTVTGYQWQRWTGSTWTNVGSSNSVYTVNLNNLTWQGNTPPTYQDQFRVIVYAEDGNHRTSSTAVVTSHKQVSASITTNPGFGFACLTQPFIMTANISGSNTGSYQWQKWNGSSWADIQGATSNVYTVQVPTPSTAGDYRIRMQNTPTCGSSLVYASQTVSVIKTFQVLGNLPGDIITCDDESLTISTNVTGSILGYQWYKNGTPITLAQSPTAQSATFHMDKVKKPNQGLYKCLITYLDCNGTQTYWTNEAKVTIYGRYTRVIEPQPLTLCEGDDAALVFGVDGIISGYQWMKDGKPLSIAQFPTANTAILELPDVGYDISGTYVCRIMVEDCFNGIVPVDSKPSQVYVNRSTKLTVPPTTVYAAEGGVASLSFDAHVASLPPLHELSVQWYRNDVALTEGKKYAGTRASVLTVRNVTAADFGSNYRVEVVGACGGVFEADFGIEAQPELSIVTQPESVTACEGQSAEFSVEASTNTALPLQYQWYMNGSALSDGSGYMGSTTSTLTVIPLMSGQNNASISCRVSSGSLSEMSSAATLTVNQPAALASMPMGDVEVDENDPLTLSVTTSGTGPVSVQWMKDGSDLSGETGQSYSKSAATAGDAGVYSVRLENTCGQVTVEIAEVTVNSGLASGVEDELLSGSYSTPNPFSGNATIHCTIPVEGRMSLVLSSSAGIRIATLAEGQVPAGEYKYELDAESLGLSSGVYYYTVTINGVSATRQMVLVK